MEDTRIRYEIYTFDQEGPIVIFAMRDLTVRVFKNLDITLEMDADKGLSTWIFTL